MQGAGKSDTIDASSRRKSEKHERDYQSESEREKLPPWRSIQKLKTRGVRPHGSMLYAITTPVTTSQTRTRDTTAATAARGSAKSAALSITAKVILTTAGGAK